MLLRALLRDSTLSGSLLDLLDDFTSAVGSRGKLLLDLVLPSIELLLLVGLEAFNSLLMFLVVSLGFLLNCSLEGAFASKLVFDLGFLGVEFFLGFLSLALSYLQHLLVVGLALLLDGVELLDETPLSVSVPLCGLGLDFFLLSSLLGCLAFSDEEDLLVVIFGFLLNVG